MPVLFEVEVKTPEISQIFQEIAIKFGWSIAMQKEVQHTEKKYIQVWNDKGMTINYDNKRSGEHIISSIPNAIKYFATGDLSFLNKIVQLGDYKAEIKQDGSLKVGCQTISKDQIDNLLNAMNNKPYTPWKPGDNVPF